VLIDTVFLDTLPKREYLAGVAEIVKTAILDSREFFQELAGSADDLRDGSHGLVAGAIARCCRVKADFVVSDERDTGRRQLLNFGHTFGHALEALAGYDGRVIHGEAVAVGMALACEFSCGTARLPAAEGEEITTLLKRLGLPTSIDELGRDAAAPLHWDELLAGDKGRSALFLDKKADNGKVNLILPYAIGDCRLEKGFAADEVMEFMRTHCRS
jgi:3-dehydroquinate synthase